MWVTFFAIIPFNCNASFLVLLIFVMLYLQTYTGKTLIAINPFQDIDNLYTNELMQKYRTHSKNTLPPHIFAFGNFFPII